MFRGEIASVGKVEDLASVFVGDGQGAVLRVLAAVAALGVHFGLTPPYVLCSCVLVPLVVAVAVCLCAWL